MTTKTWIIISVIVVVLLLIAYAIKVSLDKQAEEEKKLLYQQQLQNLNTVSVPKKSFISQVLQTFLGLSTLGL